MPKKLLTPKERAEAVEDVGTLRQRVWEVVFQSNTPQSKAYDLVLLIVIGLSIGVLMLESVASIAKDWLLWLRVGDWFFTVLFTIDYFVRVWCVRRKKRYIFSFFGIIDLLAWLPSYLVLLFGGGAFVGVVRILRLLRVFRILKMVRHMGEASVLLHALKASGAKITVFLFSVLTITMIAGTAMYALEGDKGGFTSIPQAVYWAIVTITTVGYGDIAPVTPIGKMLAAGLMVTAYAIIAVPTGIVSAELHLATLRGRDENGDGEPDLLECKKCGTLDHRQTAGFCYKCGQDLAE